MATSTTGARPVRLGLIGVAVGVGLMAALAAIMFPLRADVSDATVALVLLVPVVTAVVLGGTRAGLAVAAVGFLVFDFLFDKPYYTLTVSGPRNWVALVVYLAVVPFLARVVSRLRTAEEAASEREADTRQLLELSQLLIEDRPIDELLSFAVSIVRDAFGSEAVLLLLPGRDRLELAASAGRKLSPAELARVTPSPGVLGAAGAGSASWRNGTATQDGPDGLSSPLSGVVEHPAVAIDTETVVLASPNQPVGLLILLGTRFSAHQRLLVGGFANHLAVAVERAQLQEQALRAEVLEQVDELRKGLVGAVSHDLRTPLATIKASVSALLDDAAAVSDDERDELLRLVEEQTDRLARLVTNLLDMSRIEAGALVVERQPLEVRDLVTAAVRSIGPSLAAGRTVAVRVSPSLPLVNSDHVLVEQVLVNLLENALRYAPQASEVVVDARAAGGAMVEIAVSDEGPGFSESERLSLFEPGRPSRGADGDGGRGRGAAHEAGRWLRTRPLDRQGIRRGTRRAHLGRPRRGRRGEGVVLAAHRGGTGLRARERRSGSDRLVVARVSGLSGPWPASSSSTTTLRCCG